MDWVERIAGIKRWRRGDERAPHKPLLLLYALGRFQHDGGQPIPFSVAEKDLRRLLVEFGPARSTSPGYPFHHLTTDGLWLVDTADGAGSPGPGVTGLRNAQAAGRLHPDLVRALREDSLLAARLARLLLETNFEPSLHRDICQLTGLDLDDSVPTPTSAHNPPRDPRFRERVMIAYEYRCAFCAYSGWIDGMAVGLDAAHVRWWAFQGPDDLGNGLCLCSIHHKLFDKGVLGLTQDRTITVSQKFVAHTPTAQQWVLSLVGRPALTPQPGLTPVEIAHIDWHTSQVFRAPARLAA
ncbi:phosphorothioated DNA-binding restriction endonuclease [Acrocarpospora catenulata]|uniref:phosphorothioated DNA-binding restriction endonuclease n=1 Tax=Acrocarpospora catenulata TaxID=2836182 RepID=UPI001BD9497F|nr:HNH endonuclease [Acrocarpospora catenulata]